MIGFNLRPMWDEQIPYDLFMGVEDAARFRGYLQNATQTMMALAGSCTDDAGKSCKDLNGTCITNLGAQQNGVYNFTCVPPTLENQGPSTDETYDFLVYVIKGGNAPEVFALLREYQGQKYGQEWRINDADTRTLTQDQNFPVRLPGKQDFFTYRVSDKLINKEGRNMYMSLVICPIIATPADRQGEIPDDTCYRIYYGCYRNVSPKPKHSTPDNEIYYEVEFKLSKKERRPAGVQFIPGNYAYLQINAPGILKKGGNSTVYEDWTYNVKQLADAAEFTAFPYGYGKNLVAQDRDGWGRCDPSNPVL